MQNGAHLKQIAAALIRQDDTVLLVRQQGAEDPADSWALPGGVVEEGELLTEALVREVREETGLEVLQVGPLAYLAQFDDPADDHQTMAFVFEVREWRGAAQPADPDKVILGLEFCALPDAISRLQALSWPVMREPIVAYLRGEVSPASAWLYRRQAGPGAVLVAKLENRVPGFTPSSHAAYQETAA